MNTVICYLTALAMQFAGMNMASDSNTVSYLPNPQCEAQSINKTNIYSSKIMKEPSYFFFQEGQKHEAGKE